MEKETKKIAETFFWHQYVIHHRFPSFFILLDLQKNTTTLTMRLSLSLSLPVFLPLPRIRLRIIIVMMLFHILFQSFSQIQPITTRTQMTLWVSAWPTTTRTRTTTTTTTTTIGRIMIRKKHSTIAAFLHGDNKNDDVKNNNNNNSRSLLGGWKMPPSPSWSTRRSTTTTTMSLLSSSSSSSSSSLNSHNNNNNSATTTTTAKKSSSDFLLLPRDAWQQAFTLRNDVEDRTLGGLHYWHTKTTTTTTTAMSSSSSSLCKFRVIFVLGGPGAGKGTQSELLVNHYPMIHHLSVGQLLREEQNKIDSPHQHVIHQALIQGQIVPVEISLSLVQQAMQKIANQQGQEQQEQESNSKKNNIMSSSLLFLIDGFPRNADNLSGWCKYMGNVASVWSVLYYICPLQVLEQRLLQRGQTSNRSDDNIQSIQRRFVTFQQETVPVIHTLQQMAQLEAQDKNKQQQEEETEKQQNKQQQVTATTTTTGDNDNDSVETTTTTTTTSLSSSTNKNTLSSTTTTWSVLEIAGQESLEQVWQTTQHALNQLISHDVLTAQAQLLEAIETGNVDLYQRLCHPLWFAKTKTSTTMEEEEDDNDNGNKKDNQDLSDMTKMTRTIPFATTTTTTMTSKDDDDDSPQETKSLSTAPSSSLKATTTTTTAAARNIMELYEGRANDPNNCNILSQLSQTKLEFISGQHVAVRMIRQLPSSPIDNDENDNDGPLSLSFLETRHWVYEKEDGTWRIVHFTRTPNY